MTFSSLLLVLDDDINNSCANQKQHIDKIT